MIEAVDDGIRDARRSLRNKVVSRAGTDGSPGRRRRHPKNEVRQNRSRHPERLRTQSRRLETAAARDAACAGRSEPVRRDRRGARGRRCQGGMGRHPRVREMRYDVVRRQGTPRHGIRDHAPRGRMPVLAAQVTRSKSVPIFSAIRNGRRTLRRHAVLRV